MDDGDDDEPAEGVLLWNDGSRFGLEAELKAEAEVEWSVWMTELLGDCVVVLTVVVLAFLVEAEEQVVGLGEGILGGDGTGPEVGERAARRIISLWPRVTSLTISATGKSGRTVAAARQLAGDSCSAKRSAGGTGRCGFCPKSIGGEPGVLPARSRCPDDTGL